MTKKISASHILIMHKDSQSSRSEISKEEALTLINDILEKINSNKIAFADAAIKHSHCSSASSGGNLGEFGKGVMVKEFEDSAFELKVDEISTPIETSFGYHIIKRDN